MAGRRTDLEAAAFAALDRRLTSDAAAPLALALSGGGDSVALLHLAADWCALRGRRLIAFTVDHGLHRDSLDWTQAAGQAARAVRADWRPLSWTGAKPATGLPAAARRARHALLAEAARDAGASVILMGHTLDDVLEGERMRVADAPGLPRLRDWGPSPAWPEGRGVFLLRPLLALRRQALREMLRARGIRWLEDPANDDPRFARARARTALDGGGLAPSSEFPSAPAQARVADDGRLLLTRDGLDPRALAAALLCASGADTPPRGDSLERLRARIVGGESFQATLAGARIVAGPTEVAFGRELGRQPPGPQVPSPVWDGRFELSIEGAGLTVAALAGRMARLSRNERAALTAIPAWARGALPVLISSNGTVALPRPWGPGPALARSLAASRFAAACGEITHECLIRG